MSPDGPEKRSTTPDGTVHDLPAAQLLRAATRADHEAVDAAFLRFPLDTNAGYRAFLTAHARVLPRAERLFDPAALLDHWQGRTEALRADLMAFGCALPQQSDFALPEGEAARWGALYVLEGSRLGGAFLERQIPTGLPTRFLGAHHAPGAWRTLLSRLNEADAGPAWREQAIEGARALFNAYIHAADCTEVKPDPQRAVEVAQIPSHH